MRDTLPDPDALSRFAPDQIELMQDAFGRAARLYDPLRQDETLRKSMAAAVVLAFEGGERSAFGLVLSATRAAHIIGEGGLSSHSRS